MLIKNQEELSNDSIKSKLEDANIAFDVILRAAKSNNFQLLTTVDCKEIS